jgi:hypothetical protein
MVRIPWPSTTVHCCPPSWLSSWLSTTTSGLCRLTSCRTWPAGQSKGSEPIARRWRRRYQGNPAIATAIDTAVVSDLRKGFSRNDLRDHNGRPGRSCVSNIPPTRLTEHGDGRESEFELLWARMESTPRSSSSCGCAGGLDLTRPEQSVRQGCDRLVRVVEFDRSRFHDSDRVIGGSTNSPRRPFAYPSLVTSATVIAPSRR